MDYFNSLRTPEAETWWFQARLRNDTDCQVPPAMTKRVHLL